MPTTPARITGRRYDTGESVAIGVAEGRIAAVDSVAAADDLPWIAPGFIDLQVNGFGGREFNDPELTEQHVAAISRALDAGGVTGYLPTATTHSSEMLAHTMRVLGQACERSPEVASRVKGIHLEGPYISPLDGPRGAHPRDHCRPPDWDEFQRFQAEAGGRIRILTMSPEYEGASRFIERVVDSGVLLAIGHTAANGRQIANAVAAGARMSTHLGNGAHAELPRHHNYIWEQLADDRLAASLIADGHHLPPAVIKSFVRAKTAARCVLVSDLVGMAGMPPGRYQNTSLGDIEVLDDGRLVVAGQRQYLAGAGRPITFGIANVMWFAGVDLKTAVDMACRQAAELIGLPPVALTAGAAADLVLFDLPSSPGKPIQVRQTYNGGRLVYDQAHGQRRIIDGSDRSD